jgi:hypothetical protein
MSRVGILSVLSSSAGAFCRILECDDDEILHV